MLTQKQKKLVQDLCAKYPVGARGRLKKSHYKKVTKWVEEYKRYTDVAVLDEAAEKREAQALAGPDDAAHATCFGWSDVDVFTLFYPRLGSYRDARELVVSAYSPAPHGPALSRRARLLEIRAKAAIGAVQRRGLPGLWSVRCLTSSDWYHPFAEGVRVYADSAAAAEAAAAVVAPLVWPDAPNAMGSLSAKFLGLGSPADAAAENLVRATRSANKIESRIRDLTERLEAEKKALVEAQHRAGLLTGSVMLLCPMPEAEEEEVEAAQ